MGQNTLEKLGGKEFWSQVENMVSGSSIEGLNIKIFEQMNLSGDGWILFFRITDGGNLYKIAHDLRISAEEVESILDEIRLQLGVHTPDEFRKLVFLS